MKDPLEVLSAARLRLMLDQPYLATAVASLTFVFVKSGWCPTMATDGFRVFVNEQWSLSLSRQDLEFVIAHEVMHCILGHPDRRQHREPLAWNIAADLAVNGLLRQCGYKVPDGGLWDWRYLQLTTEEIYERVLDRDAADPEAGGRRATPSSRGAGAARNVDLRRFDLHLDPDSLLTERLTGLPPIPTPEERRRLRQRFTADLRRALRGTAAGSAEAEVAAAGEASVPWQALLARFVTGLRRTDYRLFPFNRKHIWNGLYLPSLGVPGPRHIVAAVDTSGSMDDRTLGLILSELDMLRSQTECLLTLIQCDANIQRVERLEAFEASTVSTNGTKEFRGGGGTDFAPVFDWLKGELQRNPDTPDALFFLSDGFGIFPPQEPPIPVLWIVPAHGHEEFPFGDVLRLS